jgi:transcriptional regulator with XRE-family HTH domain
VTGEELRRAIGALGMTQAAFADKMGVTPSAVYRWLSGQLPVPVYVESYLEARRFGEALRASLSDSA